jgi:hypothetical protein
MSTHHPDVWVIVELSGSSVPDTYHRVLAGWYGGYTGGDSWQMSSGITEIHKNGSVYEIHNVSGSIYYCNETAERLSGITSNVLATYANNNNTEFSMITIEMKDIYAKYIPT